jgi:transcriptional regulator with XRE-family HTH domain
MTTKDLFTANVRRMMGDGIKQEHISAAAKRAGYRIDQKTVSRALNEGNPTLKKIDAIAAGLGVQPWQLLIPEGVLHFPKIGRAVDLIQIAAALNEDGVNAALAMIAGLADRPEFQRQKPCGDSKQYG